VVDVERDSDAQTELFDKGEVGVGVRATQSMVDVDGGEGHAKGIALLGVGGVEEQQKRD
jgi:hypothetical protein